MSNSRIIREQRNETRRNRTVARGCNAAEPSLIKTGEIEQQPPDPVKDAIRRELEQTDALGRQHATIGRTQKSASPKKS